MTNHTEPYIPSPPANVWNVYAATGERIASGYTLVKAERLMSAHVGSHRSLAPLFRPVTA